MCPSGTNQYGQRAVGLLLARTRSHAHLWSKDSVSLTKRLRVKKGCYLNKVRLQSGTLLLREPAASPPLTTHSPSF